jgi:hypothetical protein
MAKYDKLKNATKIVLDEVNRWERWTNRIIRIRNDIRRDSITRGGHFTESGIILAKHLIASNLKTADIAFLFGVTTSAIYRFKIK